MALNRTSVSPVQHSRTNRNHEIRVLTSMPAGKFTPIAFAGLLREDAVRRGAVQIACEMGETAELLLNPVRFRAMVHFYPFLAEPDFEGSMDQLNRSYSGQPQIEGGDVIPFFESVVVSDFSALPIYKAAGLHVKDSVAHNPLYAKAYNSVWNFLAKNRSPDITERSIYDTSLAPAFWDLRRFGHVVPSFDQQLIDGAVPIDVIDGTLNVKGIGLLQTAQTRAANLSMRETGGATPTHPFGYNIEGWGAQPGTAGEATLGIKTAGDTGFPEITAELAESNIRLTLSNIELAKKTQAFAKIRQAYTGHSEDWVIDMLMAGLSIPDQELKQPLLLAEGEALVQQQKRFATDGANLNQSATNGATMLNLRWNLPRVGCGGVIVVSVQALPDMLWERQEDYFLNAPTTAGWSLGVEGVGMLPEAVRDTLDPEKVEIVENSFIDILHTVPDGTFGYAPLNHRLNVTAPRVGGRFYRPEANAAFDEDRQRLWAIEQIDPVLSEEFYIATNIHQKPFLITDAGYDPFDVTALGGMVINGNTQFGTLLVESTTDYDTIAAQAPRDRIDDPTT